MNYEPRASVAQMYQTDLERHLFAPPAKPGRARRQDPLADRLRDWFMAGWVRWKQLAEAANFM